MKYGGCLLAVKDINQATAFYQELFGLIVEYDYGTNISFYGGISLQENFAWLSGIPEAAVKDMENNFELYFEADDFDEFAASLKQRTDIKWLHDVREYDWGQRVIRFYDVDNHIIEVGENMKMVVKRFLDQGLTIAQIAKKLETTADDVQRILESYI